MRDLLEYADLQEMTVIAHDHAAKLAELDRLLNDPGVPDDPDRVWALAAEIARHERATPQVALPPAMLDSKNPGSFVYAPSEAGMVQPMDSPSG
ncbi:MAG: hypothetical protein ACREFY_16860 [Acetobacteraceae bacterium]